MKRYLLLITCVVIFGVVEGCGKTEPKPAPVSAGPAKVISGAEYIARDRIIFPPPASTPAIGRGPGFTKPPGGEGPPLSVQTNGPLERHTTRPGLELIRREEGFEPCVYWDPYGGVWTIGIGEAYVSANTPCESEATAYRKLEGQLNRDYEWSIRAIGGNGFPQRVFNALVDFDYNEGPYIFEINPGLRGELERHQFYAASETMLGFDIAGGQVLGDLYRRRLLEQQMMLGPEPAPPETAAQKRAKEKRALSADQSALRGLRARIVVLRRELAQKGCYPRLKARRAGSKCVRWKAEGNEAHARGIRLDVQVAKLKRALG